MPGSPRPHSEYCRGLKSANKKIDYNSVSDSKNWFLRFSGTPLQSSFRAGIKEFLDIWHSESSWKQGQKYQEPFLNFKSA